MGGVCKMKNADEYLTQPLVSVIIPTRNRVSMLRRAIHSIYECAKNPEQIEIVLRVAFDDRETMRELPGMMVDYPRVRAAIGHQMQGMNSISQFNDEAVRLARGKFIWLFSDDAWVEGRNWEEILEGPQQKVLYLLC